MRQAFTLGAALLLTGAFPVAGQSLPRPQGGNEVRLSELASRMASMSAVTGYERELVDTLLRLLPGSTRDRAGNARLTLGTTGSKRLVICPLDEPGYVVGSIRPDGYLTLRRVPGRVSPLFDQQIEGHRVTIQGTRGPVPGVVAVRSIHLTRGRHAASEDPFTVDDAYVDIGADTPAAAAGRGIRVLAPVTLAKHPHRYGTGLLAAPMAGRRAACAALVAATQSPALSATNVAVTVAFAVEQELAERGLATLANELGPFEETLIVEGRPGVLGSLQQGTEADTSRSGVRLLIPPAGWRGLGTVTRLSLPVRYAGTPVETISLADADSLQVVLTNWIGGAQ